MPYKNKEDRRDSDKRYDNKNRDKRRIQNRVAFATLYAKRKREGLCTHCGMIARPGTTQCQQCFDARVVLTKKRRQGLKEIAVKYLGGKCIDCGLETDFMSVYDFHHRDAGIKKDTLARLISEGGTWKRIQPELDKCILLCANCHRIRHEIEDNGTP
jgi:hypothetical protein